MKYEKQEYVFCQRWLLYRIVAPDNEQSPIYDY